MIKKLLFLAALFGVTLIGGCKVNLPKISVSQIDKLVGKYENASGHLLYVAEYNGQLSLYKQISDLKPNNSSQYFSFIDKMYELQTQIDNVDCTTGASGFYEECKINGENYTRKLFDGEIGKTYKIQPLMGEEEVKKIAMSSKFPFSGESKLVDLEKLDSTLKIDIRYATDDNFMGFKLYPDNKAFLEEKVAASLVKANQELKKLGVGVVVYDAYRPWYVTKMFWEATPEAQKNFVADPSKGSRHNRGYAVDIGLYDLVSGKYLAMSSGFDEFSERAYPNYMGGTTIERNNRNILIKYMADQGFTVNDDEWWHFDYTGRQTAPVLNLDFVDIK